MSSRRQEGSLQKRQSGGVAVWLGLWYEDGKRRAKTLGKVSQMTKTQAQELLAEQLATSNMRNGATTYTLKGFAQEIFYPFYRRGWKDSTAQTTPDRINHHIMKVLGEQPLSYFTRDRLQDFLDNKAKLGLSQATLAHLRWDLKQLFRLAVNEGLVKRNPADLLHIPKGTTKERRVLTIEQTQQAINALQLPGRLILKLAGICGMRPGEIIALQTNDINEQTITVKRRMYRGSINTPKTTNSYRTIALPNSVYNDLSEWRKIVLPTAEGWLFPSEKQTPLWANTVWYDKIRPSLQKIGLGWINYQVLRRTAVTLMNQTGADGSIVASICGHTLDVSQNVYNKISIERQRQAIQTLDNTLQQATTIH